MDKEMMKALQADGEKLAILTGEDHGPVFLADTLEPGQTFVTIDGSVVKLDRRVPGDGTKWYVADWWNDSWAYMDSTIEPGDLEEKISG